MHQTGKLEDYPVFNLRKNHLLEIYQFIIKLTGGLAAYPPLFPHGSGVYGFNEMQCHGNETGLSWCKHIVTTQGHVCRKGEEAGVICKRNLPGVIHISKLH